MSKLGSIGRAVGLGLALVVAVGCTSLTATQMPEPTSAPAASVPETHATQRPSATGTHAGTPSPPHASDPVWNEAPLATLVVDDAERYPGEAGGFDFGGYTQSAPWLPATALDRVEVAAGADLRVELDERATVAEWAASYAAADDPTGDEVVGLGSGAAGATFDGPPAGAWVVSVTVVYGGGAGTAAYYWHVIVS
jgi:hypothetical protein